LLDNAIKYSPKNTRIMVRIASSAPGQASIDITMKDRESHTSINRTSLIDFIELIKHGPGSGAGQAWGLRSRDGPLKRTAAKST